MTTQMKKLQEKITSLFQDKFDEAQDAAQEAIEEVAKEAVEDLEDLTSEDQEEDDEEDCCEDEDEDTESTRLQVTIRDGNILHFQLGTTGDYITGDRESTPMAKKVQRLINEGYETADSLADTSTQYLVLESCQFTKKVTLPDGSCINIPSELKSVLFVG